MAKTVRTIRFSKEELERIDQFIQQNPVFDFSRLVRYAIDQFLENPAMTIQPVKRSDRTVHSKSGRFNGKQ